MPYSILSVHVPKASFMSRFAGNRFVERDAVSLFSSHAGRVVDISLLMDSLPCLRLQVLCSLRKIITTWYSSIESSTAILYYGSTDSSEMSVYMYSINNYTRSISSTKLEL